mmetsp:Transcript_10849/g.17044  ORF Transcript_10849/g.17044 Transcript_10849/m.17044 type:complete len:88 (-) Transcript_10849:447-710(-)
MSSAFQLCVTMPSIMSHFCIINLKHFYTKLTYGGCSNQGHLSPDCLPQHFMRSFSDPEKHLCALPQVSLSCGSRQVPFRVLKAVYLS